jgi:mRNA-degrading endonuclease toxin of MazEF toxin-antitoxin module
MTAGQIVTVDWRDAIAGSGEPGKRRPGIVVSSASYFGGKLPVEIVVPLTGGADLAIPWASTLILPTPQNGCTKPCYALAWNVQSVPHARLTETPSRISDDELRQIRAQIVSCVS